MSFGGGFFGGQPQQQQPREGMHFHLMNAAEQNAIMQQGINPLYRNFDCGHCGCSTNGRVLCTLTDAEAAEQVT